MIVVAKANSSSNQVQQTKQSITKERGEEFAREKTVIYTYRIQANGQSQSFS